MTDTAPLVFQLLRALRYVDYVAGGDALRDDPVAIVNDGLRALLAAGVSVDALCNDTQFDREFVDALQQGIKPPRSVALTIPLSDDFLGSVLCTALEGGVDYWARIGEVRRSDRDAQGNWRYISAVLVDAESGEGEEYPVDYDAVARGIRVVLSPTFAVNSTIRSSIADAVAQNEAGFIDVDGADVILQAACFGELVYG